MDGDGQHDGSAERGLSRLLVGYSDLDPEDQGTLLGFEAFVLLGATILAVFTWVGFARGAPTHGLQDLFGATLLVLLALLGARARQRSALYLVTVVLFVAYCASQVLVESTRPFGLLWFYTLPFVVVFLLQARQALSLIAVATATFCWLTAGPVARDAGLSGRNQVTLVLVFVVLAALASLGLAIRTRQRRYLRERNDALAAANAEISRLARTDPLTSCYNRGQLVEGLLEEVQRAGRYGHPLALVLADVDHFKRVNDTRGHLAGDALLQAIAGVLLSELRSVDWVVRYGGEEFLLVLPETGSEGAHAFAERLRQQVEAVEVPWEGGPLSATMSFGATVLRPESDADEGELLARVDGLLYEAKESGRNRVIVG